MRPQTIIMDNGVAIAVKDYVDILEEANRKYAGATATDIAEFHKFVEDAIYKCVVDNRDGSDPTLPAQPVYIKR